MKTKRSNKLLAIFILFIFILSFFYCFFYIHSNSLNIASVRKLESESKFIKIFSTIVLISYIIFIAMGIFILILVSFAKGLQESFLLFIYLSNNGYLLLCFFTWIITGHASILIISGTSSGICFIGTITLIIIKRNSIKECIYCRCLGDLFKRIPDVFELFTESIQKDCSCFYDSNNYCALAIHYTYTTILGIGLAIATILYVIFSLVLLILWCILKALVESISACYDCCSKKSNKKVDNNNNLETNNNVEINNNAEINNNNQQENKILSINKPKEKKVESDDFVIQDIKSEDSKKI